MQKKYNYRESFSKELVDFLNKNGIKYKEQRNDFIGLHILSFVITDDEKLVDQLSKLTKIGPIVEVKYSAKELASSSFIRIHCKKQNIDIVNEGESYICDCKFISEGIERARHKRQVQPLKLGKIPSKGKQSAFYSPTVGFGEIFAD